MLVLLLAAALLQAGPMSPAADAPTTAAATPAAEDSATPRGAPATDYDFVAWCHGALSGHMALYTQVKPELTSIERPDEVATDEKNDHLQMQAGRDYLALYTRALNGVDRGRPGPLAERRKAADAQGAAIWDAFKDAPARTRMWAWVGWDLPGRCETAAKKMQTPSGRVAALHSLATARAPSSIDDALTAPAQAADTNPDATPTTAQPAAAPPADAPSAEATPGLRGPQ